MFSPDAAAKQNAVLPMLFLNLKFLVESVETDSPDLRFYI